MNCRRIEMKERKKSDYKYYNRGFFILFGVYRQLQPLLEALRSVVILLSSKNKRNFFFFVFSFIELHLISLIKYHNSHLNLAEGREGPKLAGGLSS